MCVGDDEVGRSTHREQQKAAAVAVASVMSSNDPFPVLEVCPFSGVEVKDNMFI